MLFYNVQDLVSFQHAFLKDIEEIISSDDNQADDDEKGCKLKACLMRLAKLFIGNGDKLKLYS